LNPWKLKRIDVVHLQTSADAATGDARPASADLQPLEPTVADAILTIATLNGPATTVAEVRAFFEDDHVHAAVIVADGVLLAVIERDDIATAADEHAPAVTFGTLSGRVVAPDESLEQTRLHMVRIGRRRLAVVDAQGAYLGLLCLKRTGTGFCSEDDVRARAAEALNRTSGVRHEGDRESATGTPTSVV
jgi:CBS domain-containing protein